MTGSPPQHAGMTQIPFPPSTLVPVGRVELEVHEAGRENGGPAVVLCHGFPELAYSWRHQLPALVAAGYHVIVPTQRGYGRSSRPTDVEAYDVTRLTGDLVGLLDHLGIEDATFVGHDWGAMLVWWLALLHPQRVRSVVALSVPYVERSDVPWVEAMATRFGDEHYFVHLDRRPGVADAVLDAGPARFLRNLYRTPPASPTPGMMLLDVARDEHPRGEPVMSDADLAVYVDAFRRTGFTGALSWYRNLDRDWHLLADVDPVVRQPALMVYGAQDTVARGQNLARYVPHVEEVTLDCGHWVQQERPEEVTRLLLEWLGRQGVA